MKSLLANKQTAAWLRGYIGRELSKALSVSEIPAKVYVKVFAVRLIGGLAGYYQHMSKYDYLAEARIAHCDRDWDYAMRWSFKGPFFLKRQANKLVAKFVSDLQARITPKED